MHKYLIRIANAASGKSVNKLLHWEFKRQSYSEEFATVWSKRAQATQASYRLTAQATQASYRLTAQATQASYWLTAQGMQASYRLTAQETQASYRLTAQETQASYRLTAQETQANTQAIQTFQQCLVVSSFSWLSEAVKFWSVPL